MKQLSFWVLCIRILNYKRYFLVFYFSRNLIYTHGGTAANWLDIINFIYVVAQLFSVQGNHVTFTAKDEELSLYRFA